jgi:NAD-dependent dihydropyrimidine dehydrogenase PreA subunit
MCDYCKKHAAEFLAGHRWYLNPECYSEHIAMTKDRVKIYNQILGHPIEYYFEFTNRALRLQHWPVPFLKRVIRWYTRRTAPETHAGQVVSLEDALQIVDLSENHVLLPCACRRHSGGYEEQTCLNFGVVKGLMENAGTEWELEEISRSEAKQLLEEWDAKGYFHQTLWAKQPYIICICNCDSRSCVPRKQRFVFDLPYALTKGHEIAVCDQETCDGCNGRPSCIGRCPFNAMRYDPYNKAVSVDPIKCFGCGVCRQACGRGALQLIPREQNIAVKGEW